MRLPKSLCSISRSSFFLSRSYFSCSASSRSVTPRVGRCRVDRSSIVSAPSSLNMPVSPSVCHLKKSPGTQNNFLCLCFSAKRDLLMKSTSRIFFLPVFLSHFHSRHSFLFQNAAPSQNQARSESFLLCADLKVFLLPLPLVQSLLVLREGWEGHTATSAIRQRSHPPEHKTTTQQM